MMIMMAMMMTLPDDCDGYDDADSDDDTASWQRTPGAGI